jgi:hypothetical protein
MIPIAIGSFLYGAVFGLRFKVLVLVPVTLASSIMVTSSAFIMHKTFGQTLEANIVGTFALQAGYLFGSIARSLIAASHTLRVPVRSENTARSASL